MRAVLPFHLTAGQRQALKDIGEDMQRAAADEPAAAGRCRIGQDNRRAARRRCSRWRTGCRWRSWRRPRSWPSSTFRRSSGCWPRRDSRWRCSRARVPAASRKALRGQLAAGHIDMVVGTHAIVQDDVAFKSLGLAVVDEQHRFGVLQRATLRAKGLRPDMLVMTATPIPRTLALTTYGDLDVSSIRELPPGRQPVQTAAKPDSRRRRDLRLHPRASSTPAARRTSSIRSSRSRRRSICARRRRWPITCRTTCFPATASRCCTAG